jgi:hypothetical protein
MRKSVEEDELAEVPVSNKQNALIRACQRSTEALRRLSSNDQNLWMALGLVT